MTFAASLEVRTLKALCNEVATPLSERVLRLVNQGDWGVLATVKVDPRKYGSAAAYLDDVQCVALLKKFPSLPLPPKTAEKAAMESFWAAEHTCYRTNERLSPLLDDFDHYGERLGAVLREWRKEIKFVIGKLPKLDAFQGRFGPGSTFANRGDKIVLADKFDENYTTTNQAYKAFCSYWDRTGWSRHAAAGLMHDPDGVIDAVASMHGFELSPLQLSVNLAWKERDFEETRGNRFTTVRKTAMTDRGICVEPSFNVWYQLALGSALSGRLRRAYGWSKVRVQRFHRLLAKRGSVYDSNATVDLSNASDTVSAVLVKLLLPSDWYDLLCQLRATHTLVKGKWVRLEKFSSMGNGFTFELETLLFYSLAKVIARMTNTMEELRIGAKVSVFGDDIIVPKSCAQDLVSALRFFGFLINKDKSFLSGPFRESCGGDYFRGSDVRPYFLKKETCNPSDVISLTNGINRFYAQSIKAGNSPKKYARLVALNALPRAIRRCRGPAILGDIVIHDDDENSWDSVVRGSIRYLRCWRPIANKAVKLDLHYRPGVVLATALYLAGTKKSSITERTLAMLANNFVQGLEMVPRINGSFVSGYRFGRVPYS